MKSKFNPIWIAFAIPLAAVLFALVFIFLKKSNMVSAGEEFPYVAFVENPRAYEGNAYIFKAQIDSQLSYDTQKGKMLSVRTPDGSRLSVFVPASITANMQTGQRYNFNVNVEHGGLIVVKKLEKF